MFFGEVRVDEAAGLILAHSLRLAGMMLKKGRVLSAQDIRALKAAGINRVTGARLDEGDVGEDFAAGLLTQALAGSGTTANAAFTGRCNLFAAERGLLVYDRDRLDRLNLVDEAITVAAAPAFEVVAARQMVATIKIIPFGVDRRTVEACAAFASMGGAAMGGPLFSVRPFRPLSAILIQTTLPGFRDRVLDATAAVTRARIEALGGTIASELRCPHEVGPLERTIAKALTQPGDLLLIAGASATVDRRDVVPAAILRAGGTLDHFGMPVDPGNLLLLAHCDAVPVVNLPGCGRSPKPNGLDWVLRRLAAGVAIKPGDMMRMGAGGLLKELGSRPREAWAPAALAREARVAGLVVATDAAATARAVEAALAAGLDPLMVVGGDAELEEALPPCEVHLVTGDLAAALAALPEEIDAALILPAGAAADPRLLAEMAKAFDPDEGRAIVLVKRGLPAAPYLIAAHLFPDAADPARLMAEHAELVFEV